MPPVGTVRCGLRLTVALPGMGLALLPVLAVPRAHGDIPIVREGKPAACVVLGREPTPTEVHAANELCSYVARMTGARLSIQRGSAGIRGAAALVLLGRPETNEAIADLTNRGLVPSPTPG
jgi:hypothetical protein